MLTGRIANKPTLDQSNRALVNCEMVGQRIVLMPYMQADATYSLLFEVIIPNEVD